MSVGAVADPSPDPVPSSAERLKRLIVEAATLREVDVGDDLDRSQIVKQGDAHGYSEREVRSLLEEGGYSGSESVTVPPRGDVFGDLWTPSPSPTSESVSEPSSNAGGDDTDPTLTRFRDWQGEKAEDDQTHSYTRQKANRRYAQGKDVDRSYIRDASPDEFSTVLITYTRERDGESLTQHAASFFPDRITRKRRRLLKRAGVYEGMSGLSVLAPKREGDHLRTHAHDFLWLLGHVSREAFTPLLEVDGFDVHVSVEHHTSAEIETPDSVKARGSGMDSLRGDTTALPQELGANLPMLKCRFDARGAPDYVERWSAHMREGTDGSLDTQGVRRFRKLGDFDDRAESVKTRREVTRKVEEAHSEAEALDRALEYHTLPATETNPSPDNSPDSTEEQTRSLGEEGRGDPDRVPSPNAYTDESDSDESRFTFSPDKDDSGESRFDL